MIVCGKGAKTWLSFVTEDPCLEVPLGTRRTIFLRTFSKRTHAEVWSIKEEIKMKLKTIGLICFLTFVGINVSAFSLMADDRRSDNANVSFGLWDPNKDDLNGAPLDRLVGDPAAGVGVEDIIVPQRVTIKE